MFFSVFWRELRFAGFAGTSVSPQPRLCLESLRVPKGLRRVDDSSSGGKVCPVPGVNCIKFFHSSPMYRVGGNQPP